MSLRFEAGCVALVGDCGAEEALELSDRLAADEHAAVDLTECTNMHAAVLQTLFAYRPRLAAPPQEAFLARWIAPALASASDIERGVPSK